MNRKTKTAKTKKAVKKAAVKRVKVYPHTLAGVLDVIDRALFGAYNYDLWSVLTALRGPDNERYGDKWKGTAIIRAKAFPKTAAAGRMPGDSNTEDGLEAIEFTSDAAWHFTHHIHNAADALRSIGR